MSFLEAINKRKQKLKITETTVTNAVGQTHVERNSGLEIVETRSDPKQYGFVVDLKPDDIPVLVKEHLYIGSQDCCNKSVLDKYNIRNVLSLGVEVYVEDVNSKFVSCLDLPETNIERTLDESLAFIKQAIGKRENVLVHCNAGVSRASMVVIGYLIVCEKYKYVDAYSLVKEKRPAIQPNAGFVKQLKLLENTS